MAKQELFAWKEVPCQQGLVLLALLTGYKISPPLGSNLLVDYAREVDRQGEKFYRVALLFESAERDSNCWVIAYGKKEEMDALKVPRTIPAPETTETIG